MTTSKFHLRHWIPEYGVLALLALAIASVALFASTPPGYADHEDGHDGPEEADDIPLPEDITDPINTNPALIVWFGLPALMMDDKAYTIGETDQDPSPLPAATTETPPGASGVNVTYSVTGLPDGLTLNDSRIIVGTPAATTAQPVTVTYTATAKVVNGDGSEGRTQTATMKFTVTVNTAVAFSAETIEYLRTNLIVYDLKQKKWMGAGDDGKVVLPAASGGTGALTYGLYITKTLQPLTEAAPGITFDSATRKIGGTPPSLDFWWVTYWARDVNGSTATTAATILKRVGGL